MTEENSKKIYSAIPMTRLKKIMKADLDLLQCSTDSVYVIAAATVLNLEYNIQEMFLELFAQTSFQKKSGDIKTLRYKDVGILVW